MGRSVDGVQKGSLTLLKFDYSNKQDVCFQIWPEKLPTAMESKVMGDISLKF